MGNDERFWKEYADGNESRYNEEFAGFVQRLAGSLGCTSVLEIGCGTGIDLRLFPATFRVFGVDSSDYALEAAREKLPHAEFRNGSIDRLPFEESSVDFVFTHKLLNYLDDDMLERGIPEMYRVAGRYIMNCEKFGEDEGRIDSHHKYRNMLQRWMDHRVRIVSNVDMHEDIEPDRPRFTLLKKLT